jgi:hypothetical protein
MESETEHRKSLCDSEWVLESREYPKRKEQILIQVKNNKD